MCAAIGVDAQNGFTLKQSVVASGGATSAAAGGGFSVTGTIGEAVAGSESSTPTPPLSVKSGFWASEVMAPTAATVSVSGTVTTAIGQGIAKVKVTMTDARGQSRFVVTGRRGAFQFTDVAAGETYVFSVGARKFTFAEPVITRTVLEHLTDVNFVANPLSGIQ